MPGRRVPLARLRELSGDGELLFPGESDPAGAMSANTINNALRVMGYDTGKEVRGHGFRTMARAAMGESGAVA